MLRTMRAVEILEHIATPAARDLLAEWAKGAPGARLTEEAKASLERLNWPCDKSRVPSTIGR